MFNPRRVLIATILTAGLVGTAALPAAAVTGPTPTPSATASATPTPTSTPTSTPSASPVKNAARDIRLSYVSKTVARLTWTAPSDAAGRTVHYYVRITSTLGGKALAARVTNDTTSRSLTVRDVRPGSMLTPEVTTAYRHARGRADRGATYTQNQVVPSKPTAVTLKVKAGDTKTKPSGTVTFKAPSTSGANGTLIDSYRVRLYDAANDKVVKTSTLGAGERSTDFTNLDNNKTYYARVAAHNSAGYGLTGKSGEVKTAVSPTPSPTPTVSATLSPLVQIPLPPIPTLAPVTPTATPTRTATPVPTATTNPSPTVTSSTPATAAPRPGVFRNASDTRWFTISLIVAVSIAVLLSVGTFLYYRRRSHRQG